MHIPVLLKEVLQYLDPKPGESFIDATAGEGGHALAVLEKIEPAGRVLAIERDSVLAGKLKKRNGGFELTKRLFVRNGNFRELAVIARAAAFEAVDGILFDLGFSSWHTEESGRGFSFQRDEPLDMRFGPDENSFCAKDIVNKFSQYDLAKIFRQYGDEKYAHEIAKAIVRARSKKEIKTTFELRKILEDIIPRKRGGIHPATRVFQALRIAVNDELEGLREALPQALGLLKKEGRLVVIAFHSGEDRIIKRFLNQNKDRFKLLTKKPVRPGRKEIAANPRSRSAKLRAAVKLVD